MSRYRLRSPEQPWIVRLILGTYEFCASLKLAVILIFSAAAALAFGTFVESAYGTPAVQFGIYGTWWFTLLNVLLAVNIFCAAAIRYPWKRHQTGFVITHIGLLTLLCGCWLQRRGGIDAQLPVMEGGYGSVASQDTSRLDLRIRPLDASAGASAGEGTDSELVSVPFDCGPFNWADIETLPWYSRWYFKLAERDRGVVYDRDGVKLEVLDFLSNSRRVELPLVAIALQMPPETKMDDNGRPIEVPGAWMEPQELSAAGTNNSQRFGGGTISFWMTTSAAETDAFLNSAPEGELGPRGQAVLWAAGQKHVVSIDEHLGKGPFALGDTGLTCEVKAAYRTAGFAADATPTNLKLEELATPEDAPAENPAVVLEIRRGDAPAGELVLFEKMPFHNRQDKANDVYGVYWFDYGQVSTQDLQAGKGSSRIDILQGDDQKLYHRVWNRKTVTAIGELPVDGRSVDAFKMPMGQLHMKVARHIPAAAPEMTFLPEPFNKETRPQGAFRAARVRLTVDEASKEFWVWGPPQPLGTAAELPTLASKSRRVTLSMPLDTIDVGFRVKLLDFERKLDPGTSQASHFTSIVEFYDREEDRKLRDGQIVITMNAPVDFSNPKTGRSYRLFQESFNGPIRPGDREYRQYLDPSAPRDEIYMSVLTINYDPGRGVKYAGTLLIVVGIGMMFYMRAYFFKPPARKAAAAADRVDAASRKQSEREPEPVAAN